MLAAMPRLSALSRRAGKSVTDDEGTRKTRYIPDFPVMCCFFLILDLDDLEARCSVLDICLIDYKSRGKES